MVARRKTDTVKAAETALQELELSVLTDADRKRVARIWAGLRLLDEQQAYTKDVVEEVLTKNPEDVGPVSTFLRGWLSTYTVKDPT